MVIKEKISFDNTSKAFSGKTDAQLKFSFWLFSLMKNSFFVTFFSKVAIIAIKLRIPIVPIIKATIFKQFCGGETISETEKIVNQLQTSNIHSILDYSVEVKKSNEDFEQTKKEIIRIIELAKENPAIPYTSLKVSGIIPFSLLEKVNNSESLTDAEKQEYLIGKSRLNDICFNAYLNNVPIYFDAEESWVQDTIDRLAEEMMRVYNKTKAIVLTTLQMYRWDKLDYLKILIQIAKKDNFFIGIKLVRGAYLEKENKRARELGYKSSIHVSKHKTDIDFDEAINICLENIDLITLCAGTHNEASTMHLINKMKDLNISNNHPQIYFSQLYGMSDHISYNLADAGYNVTKYLPYGPIKSVIPYLIRRAQENTAIAGQMGRELRLIVEEKERRAQQKLIK